MHLPFQLTVLGSSSAMPTSSRYPTAQVLNVLGRFFLIDCGEGTQHQIRKLRVGFSKLNHILISHLHGDHFFGLIGYLSTQILLGRTSDLYIYAHSELQRYIQFQLEFLGIREMDYKLVFHPLNFRKEQLIYEDEKVSITSFPLKHRIQCCGFFFKEKEREANIKKGQIKKYDIPIKKIKNIKKGADFVTENGEIIKNAKLVTPPPKPRSFAFCSDTIYSESFIETIKDVDLLYHEATFAEIDKKLAKDTFHSTGKEAAQVAKLANAKKLLIGHFSARYKKPQLILDEAREIFKETYAAEDGETYTVEIE